jgi:hypothetical protein
MEEGITLAVLYGVGIGAVIGAAALLSNFCALGGVADILFARDWRRMRAWILAAGVAILGTQALDALNLIHIDRILSPSALWLPTLLGGACFGFGMALAGGCINRALVRIGAGSVKSLVIVIVVWSVAVLTLAGGAALGPSLAGIGRFEFLIAPEALHRVIGAIPGLDPGAVQWVTMLVMGGGLVVFALKDSWFRASRDQVAAGLAIGAMIPLAWLVSGSVEAVNFAVPVGAELVNFRANHGVSSFALATIVGVPAGAFVAAALTRNLAWETFTDRAEIPRNLIGAALMGFGGTIALGGTFGQGLSGLSTLSFSAALTVAGIVFGCVWGIRYFEAEGVWGGLKLTFKRGV